jgi:hypothetical protein
LVGFTEKTGSPKARINKVKSKSWRKNIGGKRNFPQGRPLALAAKSANRSKLENTTRCGRFLIKYGSKSSGNAINPNKAAGLRNSINCSEIVATVGVKPTDTCNFLDVTPEGRPAGRPYISSVVPSDPFWFDVLVVRLKQAFIKLT